MKKVILVMAMAIVGVATMNAQFTKGGKTLSGRLTGFDFGVTSHDGGGDATINVGLDINGSYFVADNFAITAGIGLNSWAQGDDNSTDFGFNVGARYYFLGGLYGGLGYEGWKPNKGDLLSYGNVQVGYDYYITDNVFFEPAVYFSKGFSKGDKDSTFGLSIGIGVNF
jgi:hypothetical protein